MLKRVIGAGVLWSVCGLCADSVEVLRVDEYQTGRQLCMFGGVRALRKVGRRRKRVVSENQLPGRSYSFNVTGPWRVRWETYGAREYEIRTCRVFGKKDKIPKVVPETVVAKGIGTSKGISKVYKEKGAHKVYMCAPRMHSTLVVVQLRQSRPE